MEACRARLPGIDVAVAAVEELPFADGTFDAALKDAYRRRLGVGNGPFELTARAWAVAGTVSS